MVSLTRYLQIGGIVVFLFLLIGNALFSASGSAIARQDIRSENIPNNIEPAVREIPIPQNNSEPLAVTTDSNGTVWFAETNPAALTSYDPASEKFSSFPVPTSDDSGLIWFLIFDYGQVWFSCSNEPLLWSFNLATHLYSNFSTGNSEVLPYALALDPNTNQIWFTSIFTDQIGVFQIGPTSATIEKMVNMTLPSLQKSSIPGPRYGPSGITIGQSGEVFVTETFAASIVEYNQSSQKFDSVWTLKPGSQPVGIAVDQSLGELWFTNHASSQFGSINLETGQIETFATSTFSYNSSDSLSYDVFTLPYWIFLTQNGTVWFNEHVGGKIGRFDPATRQLTEFIIPTDLSSPLILSLDGRTGLVWFTELTGNNLGLIDQNDSSSPIISVPAIPVRVNSAAANFTIGISPVVYSNSILTSGTFASDGNITGNVTIQIRAVPGTQNFEVEMKRAGALSPGIFALTMCVTNETTLVNECGTVPVTVTGSESQGSGTTLEYALILSLAAILVIFLSVIYAILRRRG